MLGYKPNTTGEATQEMWRKAVLPEDLPKITMERERAEREHDVYRSEHRVRRVDNGQITWVRTAGRFLYDDDGRPGGS